MKIGVPTEIKPQENRVALTPAGADRLAVAGHEVAVQAGAGVVADSVPALEEQESRNKAGAVLAALQAAAAMGND